MSGARARAVALVPLLVACSVPYASRTYDEIQERRIEKIAVVPFELDPGIARASGGAEGIGEAASVVTARVQAALAELDAGFDLVPFEEVERWRESEDARALGRGRAGVAERMQHAFGADAVVLGSVGRYVQRIGGPGGASRPAAVTFSVELRAPGNVLLWAGAYEETQASLTERPDSFSRARARGFKWIRAESLADYGARQLMRDMARAASWR